MTEKHSYTGHPTAPASGDPTSPATIYPQGGYAPPVSTQSGQSGFYQHGGYPPSYGNPPPFPPPSAYQPQSGLPPPPPSRNTHPPATPQVVSSEANQYSWLEDTQRNKPQANSLAAATFIFISGGMSLAQSIGIAANPNYYALILHDPSHMQICWFIAVIIGACISTFLIEKLTKRNFNIIASVLVILNGIIFTSAPSTAAAITIARYCDGIAFGLTLIPAIVAGSEQSVKRLRGLVLSTEQVGLTVGFMVEAIYCNFWGYDWSMVSNRMHGILALIFGLMALLFAFLLTKESPVFYLRRKNESESLEAARLLQGAQTQRDPRVLDMFYELKNLLKDDEERGRSENITNGLLPMAKVCLFRIFVALSLSFALTWGVLIVSTIIESEWGRFMYSVARVLGVVISIFTLDTLGRRVLTAIALLIGACLLIAIGALSETLFLIYKNRELTDILILALFYQLFAGIASSASTCYLGEAFSVSVKPYFILVAVILENLIQIIVCYSFENDFASLSSYGYTVGALQIVFALAFYTLMPETKQTTLRVALEKFKRPVGGTSIWRNHN